MQTLQRTFIVISAAIEVSVKLMIISTRNTELNTHSALPAAESFPMASPTNGALAFQRA